MVFNLFGEITTLSKTAPNSMPYFTIITFNTYGKKLTNTLLAVFKSRVEPVPMFPCTSGVVNT